MNTELIDKIYKISEETCRSEKNEFGYGIWSHHIKPMISIVKELAQEFGADEEIVIIAALLHDLAGIKDFKDRGNHHIIGAEQAEKLLNEFNYPKRKIELVKNCIINHRSSVNNVKNTVEEICVADADAIVHMLELSSLFYVAYNKMDFGIDEGKIWIKNKIKRDWAKISSKSKLLYEAKYNAILQILE